METFSLLSVPVQEAQEITRNKEESANAPKCLKKDVNAIMIGHESEMI